jgi:hypothetical protein
MLIAKARMTVLKKKVKTSWIKTSRLNKREFMGTSETWQVMPIPNEK